MIWGRKNLHTLLKAKSIELENILKPRMGFEIKKKCLFVGQRIAVCKLIIQVSKTSLNYLLSYLKKVLTHHEAGNSFLPSSFLQEIFCIQASVSSWQWRESHVSYYLVMRRVLLIYSEFSFWINIVQPRSSINMNYE